MKRTCKNCKYDNEEWYSEYCNGCCKAHSHWERKESEMKKFLNIFGELLFKIIICTLIATVLGYLFYLVVFIVPDNLFGLFIALGAIILPISIGCSVYIYFRERSK